MSHKITPQLEYPLNDYQLEALSRLAESLPVSGDAISSGCLVYGVPEPVLPIMVDTADMAFQATRGLREASAVIWDEIVFDSDLPFTSKEHTPFCRNVRVWDAKGFSPAVELCNRHPDLLVADDWLRATTFDLYCMALKTSKSFVADWDITHIVAIHGWVKYLNEVQTYQFADTVAPAEVYHGYRLNNDTRALFTRRSNDDSPQRQYINLVINWRARSGRV